MAVTVIATTFLLLIFDFGGVDESVCIGDFISHHFTDASQEEDRSFQELRFRLLPTLAYQ